MGETVTGLLPFDPPPPTLGYIDLMALSVDFSRRDVIDPHRWLLQIGIRQNEDEEIRQGS